MTNPLRPSRRGQRIAFGLLAGVLAAVPARAQTAPVVVDVTFSTSTIERNASAMSAAVASLSRVGAAALAAVFPERARARDKRGAALRLLKLALLDVPIVHFADGLNHEFGHMARADEIGMPLRFHLLGGPWSARRFDLYSPRPGLLDLASLGGGFEAELALERRVWDRAYDPNSLGVADAVTLLDGAMGRFYYVQQDLSGLRGRPRDDLVYRAGDPTRYLYELLRERGAWTASGDTFAAARSIRSRSWLNFADAGLWAQGWNLLKYVSRGDRALATPWLRVRGVGLLPFSQFHLSPVGPQTAVGTRYRAGASGGEFLFRWTDGIRGSRLVGTGFSWFSASGTVVHPRLRADLWRGMDRTLGARVEAGATAVRWPSRRAALQLAVGAKSAGYVLGLPQKRGVYVETGLRLMF